MCLELRQMSHGPNGSVYQTAIRWRLKTGMQLETGRKLVSSNFHVCLKPTLSFNFTHSHHFNHWFDVQIIGLLIVVRFNGWSDECWWKFIFYRVKIIAQHNYTLRLTLKILTIVWIAMNCPETRYEKSGVWIRSVDRLNEARVSVLSDTSDLFAATSSSSAKIERIRPDV